VLEPLNQRYDFELVFTNNRSTDKTLALITSLREKDKTVQVLTMSRNYGYQSSVQAGMLYASGDGIIVIDVDCEDPPELISKFIEKWEEGYDIVYGLRGDRPEWWVIKKARNVFYHTLRLIADSDIVLYMAEFAIISAHVRDKIVDNKNTFPFLRAEIGYVGFSRFGVPYDRQPRVVGQTHYNLLTMVSFGVAGILTSSTFLMRFFVYLLPFFILFNAVFLLAEIFYMESVMLFKTLVVMDLVYIISLLTIQGIYAARIYKNGIGRPIFIIDWKKSHVNKSFPDLKKDKMKDAQT